MATRDDGVPNSVTCPAHYAGNGAISCMDAMRSMFSDCDDPPEVAYWRGCAFKYLWRAGKKGDEATRLEDVRKAARCLEYMTNAIARLQAGNGGHE